MWHIVQNHPAEALTLLAALFTVIGSLFGIWWQVRKQWLLHSASMVTALADRYDSADMRADRKRFGEMIVDFRAGNSVDFLGYLPVLLFFEHLAHLVRRGAIDKLMVWNRFGWEVVCYYTALKKPKDMLSEIRKQEHDQTIYEEFEWLARAVQEVHRQRRVQGGMQPSDAQVERFLTAENQIKR